MKLKGETASADEEVGRAYPQKCRLLVQEGEYPSDFVFSVYETGRHWKKMPSRNFIYCEKKHVPAEDRSTFLLDRNASGSAKLEPLLGCHSVTLRAMNILIEANLPVVRTSDTYAAVTQDIFTYWYTDYFYPKVHRYCGKNNYPRRALLLLNNPRGLSQTLERKGRL
jgi:hypothetical protein